MCMGKRKYTAQHYLPKHLQVIENFTSNNVVLSTSVNIHKQDYNEIVSTSSVTLQSHPMNRLMRKRRRDIKNTMCCFGEIRKSQSH